MVSCSQNVCFPFDDKCSATGEGQRGLCGANNNHCLGRPKACAVVLFCFVFLPIVFLP